MIISLIFAIANFYFAYKALREKRWGWCAFSVLLGGFCAYQVVATIL
jgi:hypothetical protein